MDAFLSFHASGFWLVIALLAGVVILGVRAYLSPAARRWSMIGYWGLLPYLALITGGVSPRLMGVMYVDWRASLTLGVGLALAMVALASVARISLLSGRRAAHDAPPSQGWGITASSIGISGIEEWFWCFLRGAVEETFLLMQFSLDVPAYWSIWVAAALASPFSLLHQPTAYHRLVKAAILVMTSILFFYTRNFWLCWAIHAITWLLLAQPTVAIAFTGFTGKSQAQ